FNHKYGIITDTPFAEFADGPYTNYVKQNNVNIANKTLYIKLLKKKFGKALLTDITPQDCRDCQFWLQNKYSASSVNQIMSTASKLFRLACEEGLLERNPMQFVKKIKEPPPRSRLLTEKEKERLWIALEKDDLMRHLVLLAINLPLRRAQLLAITPDAIDLDNGVLITIQSKGRSARPIPLNITAINTLRLMLSKSILPFPLKDFRKRWRRALNDASIANFRFHDLRKEFASELIRNNVNPNIVQQLFAHSDMKITNVYMHAEMSELADAVKTLDATNSQPILESGSASN